MAPALVSEKLIPWELNKVKLGRLGHGYVVAHYRLNKPSDLIATAQLLPMERPLVCLDLKENLPKIFIMNMRHRNILRIEAVKELDLPVLNQKNIAVVVEPHDGPLTLFLANLLLTEKGGNAVPSQSLRDVIRQIVEAIEELRINGVYHGDLTIHNIYHSRVGGAIVVKLVNFQDRDSATSLEAAQLMDWVELGHILHNISTAAKSRNNTASCSIIDRLASKLMALTSTDCLPSIKEETLDDMFFWDTRRRTIFYIHEIPKALNDNDFLTRVENYAWPLPWDSWHGGLVQAMNEYREEVAVRDIYKGVAQSPEVLKQYHYDGQNSVHNIQCMSGAYTHQDKIEEKITDGNGKRISVDVAVQKEQPDLCLVLYRLLAGEAL